MSQMLFATLKVLLVSKALGARDMILQGLTGISSARSLALLLTFVPLLGAEAEPSAPTIIERGFHHRTWHRTIEIPGPDGRVRQASSSFVELQTGLHRWTDQGWVEADPRIEIFQGGAVVRNLQYSVIFSQNPADGGSLDILLPHGQRLRGHLLGLAYRQGNQFVFISEVKPCAGQLGGSEQNELTFADAFTDFRIDLKYTVQRGKLTKPIHCYPRAFASPE